MTRSLAAIVCGSALVLVFAGVLRAAQVPLPAPTATLTPAQIETAGMYREYLAGDAEKAVEYFAKLARNPLVPPDGSLGLPSESLARATDLPSSLFRTEVGMRAGTFGKYAMSAPLESAKGSVGLNGMFELNSLIAYRAMDGLLRAARNALPPAAPGPTPSDRARAVDAVRSWYIVTTSHCLRWQLDCADALLAGAQQSFGLDAEILLLAGAMAESRGRPTAAETLLRQSVALDASLLEAHLRLGRLLLAAGHTTDARRELEGALAGARASGDSFVVYFASRSLADLDERDGRTAGAKAHAAEASALKPFAHPLFGGLQPLAVYRAAEFYQQPRRIAELRALVRR